MAQRSAELQAQGVDVISLAVGEPVFPTPEHIAAAASKAIADGWTKYSPVVGYADLRQAVCDKLLKENGLTYAPSEVVISGGAKQSLCNAILSLVDEGDEVIIPAPFWVSYPQMVLLAGGVPVHVSAGIDQGFKISPDQLESAITPRTRMLILCSPSNPSGAVYTRSELEGLAQVVLRHPGLFVLSDEIYEHINYTGSRCSIASIPGMRERTIVVNGVSKAYAMTGWRIGYMAAPQWLADACNMLQGQYTSGPSSVSQRAALAALTGPQDCVEQMRRRFQLRRDLLVTLLREIPGLELTVPDGAFYLLPSCKAYFGKMYVPENVDGRAEAGGLDEVDDGGRGDKVGVIDDGGRGDGVDVLDDGGRVAELDEVDSGRKVAGLEACAVSDGAEVAAKCVGRTPVIIKTSTDLAMYLLDVAHVATVAGDPFGAPDCIRLSYATSEDHLREAVRRIAFALAALK